jgi:hypothetical protein
VAGLAWQLRTLWQMGGALHGRDKKTECGVMRLGLVASLLHPEMSMLSGRWSLVAGRWSARPVPAQKVFWRLELHDPSPSSSLTSLIPGVGVGLATAHPATLFQL